MYISGVPPFQANQPGGGGDLQIESGQAKNRPRQPQKPSPKIAQKKRHYPGWILAQRRRCKTSAALQWGIYQRYLTILKLKECANRLIF
jgi:hypothetical protein